jgi:hypothetical protein
MRRWEGDVYRKELSRFHATFVLTNRKCVIQSVHLEISLKKWNNPRVSLISSPDTRSKTRMAPTAPYRERSPAISFVLNPILCILIEAQSELIEKGVRARCELK